MIELHPFAAGKKWFLEGDEQVGGEGDIVGNGHEFEYDVDGEIDLTELSFGGLIRTIENKHMEYLADFDDVLESVDIGCDQDDVVVGECLQQGDDSDEGTRMLPAFATWEVEDGEKQAD